MKTLKEEYQDRYTEISNIADEAKKLDGVRVFNGIKCISDSSSIPFLLNRIESLELYHAHTERKLEKIRKLIDNPHFEHNFTQNSDMRGYQECLKDLKKLLGDK